jgi:hypothetical protein
MKSLFTEQVFVTLVSSTMNKAAFQYLCQLLVMGTRELLVVEEFEERNRIHIYKAGQLQPVVEPLKEF